MIVLLLKIMIEKLFQGTFITAIVYKSWPERWGKKMAELKNSRELYF